MSVDYRANTKGKAMAMGEKTALVVDDDEGALETTKDFLESEGYFVDVATTVQKAKQKVLDGLNCSVVVTDFNMPGGDGIQLFSYLREERPDVGVIMMSGYPDDIGKKYSQIVVDREGGVLRWGSPDEDGCIEIPILTKPFQPAALVALVREIEKRNSSVLSAEGAVLSGDGQRESSRGRRAVTPAGISRLVIGC